MGIYFGDVRLLLCILMYTICETLNTSGDLDCFVNYVDTIHCTWSTDEDLGDCPFSLILNSTTDVPYSLYTCDLIPRRDVGKSYNCTTSVEIFTPIDKYNIYLQSPCLIHNGKNRTLLIKKFHVSDNIIFDPPYNLEIMFGNNTYTILWNVHEELKQYLISQLQFRKKIWSWKEAKSKQTMISELYMEIHHSELEYNSSYVVRIRCKPIENVEYKSHWSEWSSELQFQTLPSDFTERNWKNTVIFLLVTLITAFIVLYLLFSFNVPARVKVSLLKNVPTAAEFFHPLYNEHSGNFQEWVIYHQKNRDQKQHLSSALDLRSFTVLNLQVETISRINCVTPLSAEDIPITEDVTVNKDYPTLLPVFDDYDDKLNNDLSDLEYTEINYVSYEQ